jgi:hypothetical protein
MPSSRERRRRRFPRTRGERLNEEWQPVHDLQNVAQDIAGAELGSQLGEHLADLLLDGIGAGGAVVEQA